MVSGVWDSKGPCAGGRQATAVRVKRFTRYREVEWLPAKQRATLPYSTSLWPPTIERGHPAPPKPNSAARPNLTKYITTWVCCGKLLRSHSKPRILGSSRGGRHGCCHRAVSPLSRASTFSKKLISRFRTPISSLVTSTEPRTSFNCLR